MSDVPDQLREWAQSLADSVAPTEIGTLTTPALTPAEPRGHRRWLAVAASIVIVIAGIAAVATLSGGDDQVVPATDPTAPDTVLPDTVLPDTVPPVTAEPDPPPTTAPDGDTIPTPTTVAPTTVASSTVPPTTAPDVDRMAAWPEPPAQPVPIDDIPRLLPAQAIDVAGVPVRGEAPGLAGRPTFTQVFADGDRDIVFVIQSYPAGGDATPDDQRRPVAIDGWDDAYHTVGALRLVAFDPGGFVRLMGMGLDDDEAESIIASMQRRPGGAPGWDLAADFDDLVEINGAWNDSAATRYVTWFDGNRVVAQMLVSPAHTDLVNQALAFPFDEVDVNGAPGWLDPSRAAIVWSPDGENVVVLGVADDRIDPLAVARSVIELNEAEYEAATSTEPPPGLGDGCSASLFC